MGNFLRSWTYRADLFGGYDPPDLLNFLYKMFGRRRATAGQLEQGRQEMLAAQQRLEEERKEGTEMPRDLEDAKGPEVAEGFESPGTTQRVEVRGSEEMPKSPPKSLGPPVPAEEETRVMTVETKVIL